MNETPEPRTSDRTATAAIWLIGGRLLGRSIDLLALLILARLLSPAEFGKVAVAMTLIYLIEALLEMPLVQALVRVPQVTRKLLDTAFTLSLLRGLIIALLLATLAWPYAHFNRDAGLVPLILVLGLAPVIRGLASPAMVTFVRAIDFRRDFLLDVMGKCGGLVAAVSVAYLTRDYWAVAAGTVVAPCIMAVASYYFAPYRPRLTLAEWPAFSNLTRWNTVSQVLGAINWQFDRLLLGRFASREDLGRFAVSSDISAVPFQALVLPVLRPLIAGFAPLADDTARLAMAYKKASAAVVVVGAPMMIGMGVLSESIVRLALGPQWDEAVLLLALLALGGVVPLIITPFGSLAMSLGRVQFTALQSFLEFAFKVPAMLVGVYLYGLLGVVAARIIGGIVLSVTAMLLVRHLIKLRLRDQILAPWRPLVASAAMGICLLPLRPDLGALPSVMHLSLGFVAAVAAGGLLYGIFLLLLWHASGRPAGSEEIIYTRLTSALRFLRKVVTERR